MRLDYGKECELLRRFKNDFWTELQWTPSTSQRSSESWTPWLTERMKWNETPQTLMRLNPSVMMERECSVYTCVWEVKPCRRAWTPASVDFKSYSDYLHQHVLLICLKLPQWELIQANSHQSVNSNLLFNLFLAEQNLSPLGRAFCHWSRKAQCCYESSVWMGLLWTALQSSRSWIIVIFAARCEFRKPSLQPYLWPHTYSMTWLYNPLFSTNINNLIDLWSHVIYPNIECSMLDVLLNLESNADN